MSNDSVKLSKVTHLFYLYFKYFFIYWEQKKDDKLENMYFLQICNECLMLNDFFFMNTYEENLTKC